MVFISFFLTFLIIWLFYSDLNYFTFFLLIIIFLVTSTYFYLSKFYLKEKKYLFYGYLLGILFGSLYAFHTIQKFPFKFSFYNKENFFQGEIKKISSKSLIILLKKEEKYVKVRLYFSRIKNITSFSFQKKDMVSFSCDLKEYFSSKNLNTFQILEILQGTRYFCWARDIRLQERKKSSLSLFQKKIKQWVHSRIENIPDPFFAKGFLLADTSSIDPFLLGIFQKMGLSHLFSSSGIHLGLLFGLIFLPFKLIRLNLLGQLLGFTGSLIFLILLDFRVSLLRAFFFLFFYLFMKGLDRRTSPLYILFSTAIFIEILYPLSSFSPSFILSFGITAFILVGYKDFRKMIRFRVSFLRDHLALTYSTFFGFSFSFLLAFQKYSCSLFYL